MLMIALDLYPLFLKKPRKNAIPTRIGCKKIKMRFEMYKIIKKLGIQRNNRRRLCSLTRILCLFCRLTPRRRFEEKN